MAAISSWIKAARLRTLPLALSSIAMGGVLAWHFPGFNLWAVVMAAVTTLFLQILSNFANDYGDSVSGIDNSQRIGPRRTVQTGEISREQMRKAIFLFSGLSLVSGLTLIFLAADLDTAALWLFIVLGLAAIVAAIKYTVGKNPYGYLGLGDIFVFIFFGILGVGGTFFLATQSWDPLILLPASAMGLLSTGVLNLNNMRDIDNDRNNHKYTVVVKIGIPMAFIYHCLLVLLPFIMLVVFLLLAGAGLLQYLFLIILPLFLIDLFRISRIQQGKLLDPFLRKLALKTLLLSVVFGILFNI
jgi:1,4-dihydroxy-2-naphthoate polyprenyltransferase